MTRRRLPSLVVAICVAALASGCGDDTPSGPTRITPRHQAAPPAPEPPSAPTTPLGGMVLDYAGRPVGGAAIAQMNAGRRVAQTVSDSSGAYLIWVESTTPDIYLEVEKPGFETSTFKVFLDNSDTVTRDLRLHPLVRVAVGQWAYVELADSDPVCAFAGGHRLCRRVHIDVSHDQPLTVVLRNADRLPPFRIQLAGDPSRGGTELSLPEAAAGQELVVEVLLLEGRGPHLLELIALGGSHAGWWDY